MSSAAMSMTFESNEVTEVVLVKNTFLTVESQPRRRTYNSLPPSLRFAGGRCEGTACELRKRSAKEKELFSDASSDVSGGDFNSTESGGSVVADTEVAELSENDHEAVSVLSDHGDHYSAVAGSPISGPAEPAPCTVALNPKARAWNPAESLPVDPSDLQVHTIAMALQTALVCTGFILRSQVLKLPQGWSVAAEVPLSQFEYHREGLLRVAKETMLATAELSCSVYVMGYKWRPFVSDALGFSATLCDVQDGNKICWSYLQNGSCRFGGKCKWRHDNMKHTTINVALLPSEA